MSKRWNENIKHVKKTNIQIGIIEPGAYATGFNMETGNKMYGWMYKHSYYSGYIDLIRKVEGKVWSLLFVIPGIVKSFAYSMSYYILADNPELTAKEALNKSKEMMNGHKWDLFVLNLSFFWWYLLVGITFGIAAIYVVPYMNATIVNFYNSIKEG